MQKPLQHYQLIKHGILSYDMQVDQVLISGQPGMRVTTTQSESRAKIEVYYLIVNGESHVHEPPAKDQVQPNADPETWFDFFEETRQRAMNNRIARKADGRAHVFQYEENRYSILTGEMALILEQVLADGVPAVRATLKIPTGRILVDYCAFASPMPPLYLLDHPSQWTQTWMEVSQAALPAGKHGESWRPEKVEPNNDMDTYQDYLAWSLAVTRAKTLSELFS